MNVDELFQKLEPPAGGVERFASRLEAESNAHDTARRRDLALAAAATVAAIAIGIVVWFTQRPDDAAAPPIAELQPVPNIYDSPAFDRLLGRPLQPAELTATVDQQPSTLTELESQNSRVRIYRID
jgi:hypothetical protein